MNTPRRLLVALAVLAGLASGGCRARPRYRPVAPPNPAVRALDTRPDLPGVPTAPGDEVFAFELALRTLFPSTHPLEVRLTPIADPYLGVTYPDPLPALGGTVGVHVDYLPGLEPLVIEVRDDQPGWVQRDILLHEYAHCLAWGSPGGAHGPVWAAWYGVLWKATRGES